MTQQPSVHQHSQSSSADRAPGSTSHGHFEPEPLRLTRNLAELLGELRVALPGVQVLFAFLLTVPFSARFTALTQLQRHAYFAVLSLTAVATALLIAPTAYHRLVFRRGKRRELIDFANLVVILGLGALALSIVVAMMLIADVAFGWPVAVVSGTFAAATFLSLWYLIPLSARGPVQNPETELDDENLDSSLTEPGE
jgi:hypothetical protein